MREEDGLLSQDIVVVGGGPGGYVAAIRAAQLGGKVTLIEKAQLGGTCLNRGCIPSKAIMASANLFEKIRKADTLGVVVNGGIRIDMDNVMERKNRILQEQRKGIHHLLRRHGIRVMEGAASWRKGNRMGVQGERGVEEVTWDKLVLATGSRPSDLPGLVLDGERILSSDHALELKEIPSTVLIVGGGVIGCEFAFILSSLGANVVVVEAMNRLLPLSALDAECSKVLQREMKKRKIAFHLNRVVSHVQEKGDVLEVAMEPSPFLQGPTEREATPIHVTVEKILVCVGRVPVFPEEGEGVVGIRRDSKGWVHADARMETTEPGIYAVGDVLGPEKVMLAHVASMEGRIAAENVMGGSREMDYSVVPGAIFTSPEVAYVGATEEQAKEAGIRTRSDVVLFRVLGKAHAMGEIAGQVKIVSEVGTKRILGIHMIGPHVTELLGEATLAVRSGCRLEELGWTIHPHPTLSEIMMEAALKGMDEALHG